MPEEYYGHEEYYGNHLELQWLK